MATSRAFARFQSGFKRYLYPSMFHPNQTYTVTLFVVFNACVLFVLCFLVGLLSFLHVSSCAGVHASFLDTAIC